MKNKGIAFFTIVVVALALVALFVITRGLSNNTSAKNPGEGYLQAGPTLNFNKSILELANLSTGLQNTFSNPDLNPSYERTDQLKDSMTLLKNNAEVLTTILFDGKGKLSSTLHNVIDSQIHISKNILHACSVGDINKKNSMISALNNLSAGDRVHTASLLLQTYVKKYQQTISQTTTSRSRNLSTGNLILLVLAIAGILIIAGIIIRRQLQQLKLIDELKRAERMALKSKDAKDEFLANMSHELRTPLNALIGFGNLLKDTSLSQAQKEYVEIIRSSGYNLLNIVNDVLDLSKIEAGKMSIVNKRFDLYRLFDNIEKMFSKTIEEKGLQYQSFIEPVVPQFVIGDPERLRQVFVNLIGNAIKFTRQGGIQVNASIVWIDEDQKFYKLGFTVKDTGSGIPKDKIETIFERFEQLEHGAQRQHGGTGLGLTIVKNLVRKMGGSISVYSQVNEGSEFTFTCILEKPETVQNEVATRTHSSLSFKNRKILLVEDNKTNQVLLKHILGRSQLEPISVNNGKEAIDLLKKETYDLVLMDIQMPVMDGYTAIAIMRKELHLTTPVIAMTAYVSEGEVEKCHRAGFNDYLPKPIDEKRVVEKISKYLPPSEKTGIDRRQDLRFLKELIGEDSDVINEVLAEMGKQWNMDKRDLIAASGDGDYLHIRGLVHRLKSTFSALGSEHRVYKILLEESKDLFSDHTTSVDKCEQFIQKIDAALDGTLKSQQIET